MAGSRRPPSLEGGPPTCQLRRRPLLPTTTTTMALVCGWSPPLSEVCRQSSPTQLTWISGQVIGLRVGSGVQRGGKVNRSRRLFHQGMGTSRVW